jgi:hypothetical protein
MFTTITARLAAQRQASLLEDDSADTFELTPSEPAAVKANATGWFPCERFGTRASGWRNLRLPGVIVRHCGHPTALRPYYLMGVNLSTKFSTLAEAQAAAFKAQAEGLLATQEEG